MEDAMHILQQAEDMVKLRIQKDEDNIGTISLRNPPLHLKPRLHACDARRPCFIKLFLKVPLVTGSGYC